MSEENEFSRYKFMVTELKWRIERLASQVAGFAEDSSVGDRRCSRCDGRFIGPGNARLCPACKES